MLSDFLIFIHPAFGILGILATVWLLVEALNANDTNNARLRKAAWSVAFLMLLTLLFGGQWYVVYYPVEKAVILHGPWPFAHNFFMEVKEHLFFIPLILALYLPIIVNRNKLNIKFPTFIPFIRHRSGTRLRLYEANDRHTIH